MKIDLKTLADTDQGDVTNTQLGAALRLLANADLVNSRPRRIAILGSRYMADHPELTEDALALLRGAEVSADAAA